MNPPMLQENPIATPNERLWPPASLQEHGSTLLEFLLIVARRKKFIVAVTAAFAIVTVIFCLIVPPEYTATVTILPPQQSSPLSSSLAMQLAGLSSIAGLAGDSLGIKNIDDLYIAMLKSKGAEDAVIRRFDLLKEYHKKYFYDARKSLEWHTSIDGSTKNNLISISFENHDPRRAVEIANGYVDELRSLSQHVAITEASERRMVFEQQLEKTKNDLTDSEEALKQTELTTGMVQINSQATAMIESAARLRAQVVAKQVQIQAMRSYAGDGNPALLEQQEALDGLRNQYQQLVGASGLTGTNDLFLSKGNVPQVALEYARKLRDVKYNEAIFEVLARQLEIAKLDEAKEGGVIQIVDPASIPERRSFPKRTLMTLGATLVGFSLSVLFALLEVRWVRMSMHPVKAEQLDRLRTALWNKVDEGRTARPSKS
jgi:tyrosine-protein kinase Etk/Wzc